MKIDRLIICVVLALVAFVVCSCKKEPDRGFTLAPGESKIVGMRSLEEEKFWNEKDENGVSNAEYMARTNREYERREVERKRQKEEAAIEREAEIQARAAMKLIELMEKR